MSDVKKDHSVGAGTGAVGGALTGAAVGAAAGPVGSLVGAAVGGVVGAKAGDSIAEAVNPTTVEKAAASAAGTERTRNDSSAFRSDVPPRKAGLMPGLLHWCGAIASR